MRETPMDWWRCWASPAGAMAGVMLAAQFFWRGVYLWGGFYTQDDFKMLLLGRESDLTWSYLMQEYSGHVWPGNFLIAWVAAQINPSSWTLTATMVLLIQLACGVLMWVILNRITAQASIQLSVLAIYLTCPLTLWATQWWASAIGFLPLCFFMLLAVWGLLRRIQDAWHPGSAVVVLAMVGGLAFQERAVLFALLLGGVAVLLAEGSLWNRIRYSLISYPKLWIGLAGSMLLVLAVHFSISSLEVSAGSSAGGDSGVRLVRDFVFRNVLPGLAGGPWLHARQEGGTLVPTPAAAVIGSALAVACVLLLCVRGGRAGRLAMLLLGLYVVADMALLFAGRTRFGGDLGLVPRYGADTVPVACLMAAFALASQHPRTDRFADSGRRGPKRRNLTIARGAALAAYVAMAVVSTSLIAPMSQHHSSRAYVETLRDQIRTKSGSVLYDATVPDDVMVSWFLEDRRVSTVLAAAAENPVFEIGSESLLIPDASGVLEPVELALVETLGPPLSYPECGYALSPGLTYDVVVPDGVLLAHYVLKLGYYSGEDAVITVSLDGRPQHVVALKGAHDAYLPIEAESTRLRLGLEVGGTVCVTSVVSGFPAQGLD